MMNTIWKPILFGTLLGFATIATAAEETANLNVSALVADWFCPAYVPVSQLTYVAFRSKAKHCLAEPCMCERGLLPPSDEWRRLALIGASTHGFATTDAGIQL
jgi:hypothetical protein